MTRRLFYSPEARAQLDEIETYLVDHAGATVADAYLDRLVGFCNRIALDPISGHHRDDLVPGMRTRTFEKSRIICFLTISDDVHIVAVYSASQDWERSVHACPPDVPTS